MGPRTTAPTEADGAPFVSVLIPVLNEAGHIRACLDSVLGQRYPRNRLEVLVIDGGSTDATRQIVHDVARYDDRVRLLDNPGRIQAAAMNVGIKQSKGEFVARLDGHAEWRPDHVRRAVEILRETSADNVGGGMDAYGTTAFGQAVARGTRSRFGIGNAQYRYSKTQAQTDTVYLGVFRKAALIAVDGFDPSLAVHEDYELNTRLRARGGLVIFSPELETRYHVRETWQGLARQYFRYGRGKGRVALSNRSVIRPRHVVAPLFVACLVLAVVGAAAGKRRGFVALLAAYGLANLVATVQASGDLNPQAAARLPLVFATLHLAWGTGMWAAAAEKLAETLLERQGVT